MEELLQRLEIKVKKMLEQHQHLKQAHEQLHELKAKLSFENEHLMIQRQKTALQLSSLISKLKSLEK